MPTVKRPTSPHLSIYKPQFSSILSITHRMTGVALYAGTLVLVIWLCTVAYAPQNYATLHHYLGSIIGQVLLFGWTFALYYHLCNGIRHLMWDTGHGLTVAEADRSAWAVMIATLVFTLGTWGLAYMALTQGAA